MEYVENSPRRVTNHDIAAGAGMALLSKFGAVIELISHPIYIWLFGLTSYGLYAVLWSAINMVENFADLGMTSALQRMVPQAGNVAARTRILRLAVVIGLVPCTVVALAAFLMADQLAEYMNVAAQDRAMLVDHIRLFSAALPLWAFVEIATSALRACRVFGAEIRLRTFWEQLVRLALAVGFWWSGFDITGLLLAHLLSLGIVVLLSGRLLARHYDLGQMMSRSSDSRAVVRELMFAGLATLPYNIATRLYSDAPALILNVSMPGASGAKAAALYIIARKISSLAQMIRVAFAYVVAPLASQAAASGDREAISELYGYAARLSTTIALPLTAAICAGAPAILDYFGHQTSATWVSIAILSLARALEAAGGQAAQIQQVIGRYRHAVYGSFLGITLAGAIAAITIPLWGLDGASASVAAGLLLSTGISLYQVHRHHDMHPFDRRFAATATRALGVAAMVVIGSSLALELPRFIRILAWLLVFMLGLWSSLRLALSTQDKSALGRLQDALRL